MKSWLFDTWFRIRASYWFVPSLMAVVAMSLSTLMVYVDRQIGPEFMRDLPWLYDNQADGARSLLSTLAGSMITVAGVTFSMTLLAVSHASAQIGPRLLTGFMRDRANQFTLGTFTATFLYCLLVLRTVRSGVEQQDTDIGVFVPHLAISLALVLAVTSVLVLIYFIHHVPQSIAVPNVVARVGNELVEGIRKYFPEHGENRKAAPAPEDQWLDGLTGEPGSIRSSKVGEYLRVLDTETLLDHATGSNLKIRLLREPGDFVVKGQALMQVWPSVAVDEDIQSKLLDCFSWGDERTRENDILFPVEQLMEVFGKALSPGINGQYAAILCLNQFERALVEILARDEPHNICCDKKGIPRLQLQVVGRRRFITELFGPIRQYVAGDWLATRRVLEAIERLFTLPQLHFDSRWLTEEAELIHRDVNASQLTGIQKDQLLAMAQAEQLNAERDRLMPAG